MGDRKFKVARWVNPPFVLLRWPKERPGLNFGIIKFDHAMKNKNLSLQRRFTVLVLSTD